MTTPTPGKPDTKSLLAPAKYLTAQQVFEMHRNADTDKSGKAIHHTLGGQRYQAAPGDHIHDGGTSSYLWEGQTVTGSRGSGTALLSLLQILKTQGLNDGTTA
jgi:hypothetical protein